jgi:hypothetical protein
VGTYVLIDTQTLEDIMRSLTSIAALCLLVAVPLISAAQKKDEKAKDDKGKKATKSDPAATPDLYPQPTEVHKEMAKADQGVWDTTMKAYFSGPDQPPQEFKGIETVRAIADGLWVVSDFESDFIGGKKYKGHGMTGYDTRKKKIVGAWVDNMNTTIGTLEGSFDMATNSVTMTMEMFDPMSGQTRKDKHVTEYKGDGHKLFTIYMTAPGSNQQRKLIEIESKRRKDAAETKAPESKTSSEAKKAK